MVTMRLYATGLVATLSVTFLAQIENGELQILMLSLFKKQ